MQRQLQTQNDTLHFYPRQRQKQASSLDGCALYLFTSLASLAMKKPRVPSSILTWLPGFMSVLWGG